jgi:thermitase
VRLAVAGAAALALLLRPATADAARFAVGVAPGASLDRVAARVGRVSCGSVSRDLAPLRALVVDAPSANGVRTVPGVEYVEHLDGVRRTAFVPNDPLAPRQWYLDESRAFEAWDVRPELAGVRVAIVDSGVEGTHPELVDKVVLSRSFVGGSPLVDRQGHGTFLAGQIAAATDNGEGIAGIAPSAQLIVAKVVRTDRTIPLEAEARAIRWVVDRGARVVNLSLGGLRDPRNPARDTFSPLEAAAVDYAWKKGAVVVAAVGNADEAPRMPWPYANYPAALPHVIGVGALARDGSVPDFSDRDPIYNDLVAPGEEILSTFPRPLTAVRPTCADQGYSDCGPREYRNASGTSFAAAQVSGAAAVLLGTNPKLRNDQVAALLEHAADDANVTNGCRRCPFLRDSLSGWGRLDIARAVAALAGPLPIADRYETNDDAGSRAATIWGGSRTLRPTIDFWDDQTDVYRLLLRAGQRFDARVQGPARTNTNLVLWKPGTRTVEPRTSGALAQRAATAAGPGRYERLVYRVPKGGWYYLEVKLATPGSGRYTLMFAKR